MRREGDRKGASFTLKRTWRMLCVQRGLTETEHAATRRSMSALCFSLAFVTLLGGIAWAVLERVVFLEWMVGIAPRTREGMVGIVVSPFLHSSFQHLFANIPSLFLLSAFLFYERGTILWKGLCVVTLLGGALVWCLARDSLHGGSSLLVYGLVGMATVWAWRRHSQGGVFIMALLAAFYGPGLVFWSSLPMSWESHWAGLLVGAGWMIRSFHIEGSTDTKEACSFPLDGA